MSEALKGKMVGFKNSNYGKKHGNLFKQMMRERMSGENNPRWIGGGKGYRGTDWKEVRQKALERDNHTCQCCGSKKDIHVHHLIPYKISKDNSLSNLISLCRSCHTTEDMAYSKLNLTEGVTQT